ncbi:hypothetical protein QOZ89_01515 [Pseudofrankia sp. BMG5.37]|nr:hypothetical protein [Pseudofrankia sp. BMG5.37]MDT3438286.1 hypothetical protein [Pseudofrankia sp. BMG5.37]
MLFVCQILRDAASHDTPGESPPLFGQLRDPTLGPLKLRVGLGVLTIKFGAELGADLVLLGFGEADAGVVALHSLLDGLQAEVGHGAVGAALVTAQTEEVEVLLGPRDAQAAAALGADDGALEVVVVDALLLTGHVVGLEDLLDTLEEAVEDERLVAALVLGSVEEDFADVVAVT